MHEMEQYPRVGVPWRTAQEEAAGARHFYGEYLAAISAARGHPVEISLSLAADELVKLAESLDAIVLPGSPADVDPKRYGETRHRLSAEPDVKREYTDGALLDHALATRKPVLAICYGIQLLNVHLGGSLVQDIPSELHSEIDHARKALSAPHAALAEDVSHAVVIANGEDSRIGALEAQANGPRKAQRHAQTECAEVRVNSSHHQAVRQPGRGLRITAHAMDGVVEAVEWTGDAGWVVGVQWHPERMRGDPLADALFRELVLQAQGAARPQ